MTDKHDQEKAQEQVYCDTRDKLMVTIFEALQPSLGLTREEFCTIVDEIGLGAFVDRHLELLRMPSLSYLTRAA